MTRKGDHSKPALICQQGAWILTSIKSEALRQVGAQYFRQDLTRLANGPHRGAIIEKLRAMGVTHASALKTNQLGTFSNFINELKQLN